MESSHVIAITNIVEDNNNVASMKGNKKALQEFPLPLPPIVSHVKKNESQSSIVPINTNNEKEDNQQEQEQKKKKKKSVNDTRKMIHSIKVGISLVLVSLLYLLNPLFDQVGENAMWAIMTVIVTFEFSAGATLGKGLNRGMGTIIGGVLGCLAAVLAQCIGGAGNSIIIACSVFIFGSIATYFRLNPRIKKRYDYGMMIFILTFNLVVVSGVRGDIKVWELARERLLNILMGFIVCICVSLFVFPLWASDELHDSIVKRFHDLANTIQGCLGECTKMASEKENQHPGATFTSVCKSVLNSKSKDELLANFAKWEPWHGKFGFSYPWEKYLKIGDTLGELATFILAVGRCLQSSKQVGVNLYCKTTKQTNSSMGSFLGSMDLDDQPIESLKQSNSLQLETFEAIESRIAWTLRELGDSMKHMRKCEGESNISVQLKAARAELSSIIPNSKKEELEDCEVLTIATFVFLLMEVVGKVEELVKQVEELGEIARFRARETS